MEHIITVGLDLAKHVFQVHGADRNGAVVLRKKLRRDQLLAFFANCPDAWSPWRLAVALIIGGARLVGWDTR